jgi:lipopolysaccharide export system permease protein
MNRLQRYLFRNALFASAVALMGLVGMIWISQAVRQLDLVTGKGQTLLLFLQATILVLPQLMLIIAPIALFVGTVFALNRLNADSELVVMSAAGMRPRQLLHPFLTLGLVVMVLCGILSLHILPESGRALREILTRVRTDVITRILEEGRFVELDRGVVFHYRTKAADGALLGVLLQDRRNSRQISTYIAEKGSIAQIGKADYLVLSNGSLQRNSQSGREDSVVTFAQYAFDLNALQGGAKGVVYFPSERSTWELLTANPSDPAIARDSGRIRAELHERFAAPLFALVAMGIAFAALGRPLTTRQGRGWTIATACLAMVAARSAAFGAFTLGSRFPDGVIAMYALPLGIFAICLLVIFIPARRSPSAPAAQSAKLVSA